MKKLSFLLVLFALQAFARDQFLLKATNDEDGDVSKLYLVLDENSDILKFKKLTYGSDRNLVKRQEFSMTNDPVAKILLDERDGREILVLESDNFSTHQGADIDLVYLYNGITGSKGKFSVSLERDGDSWGIFKEGRKLNHLHLVTNKKFMVGSIGIKYIQIKK